MKNYSVVASISVALFSLFILGCAKAPDQELKNANASLDSALTVQADKYAAVEFASAKDSRDGAVAEIAKQNAASPLKKNYAKAKSMLASATIAAYNAKNKAVEGKKQVAAEVNIELTNANTLLTEVKDLIDKLPKGKANVETMKAEVTAAETLLGEAQTANGTGDYMTARDKANNCISNLDTLKNTVAAARAKTPAIKNNK